MQYEYWKRGALMRLKPNQTPILPQPGFQYKYLSSNADFVLGGGSAGGGKTYGLLLEAGRHANNNDFSAMVFRRESPEITNPGGLWDEANKIYSQIGGRPVKNPLTWHFPAIGRRGDGARVVFSHLQHEADVMKHHGGQYPLICFDELTTFHESQFWYLLSRNRSTIGIKPYIRATTNPETSGFVKDFISWYLYPDNHPNPELAGYPIPERDGVVRYFARSGGVVYWGNTPREVVLQVPDLFLKDDGVHIKHKIKSFTFIRGDVYDNTELLKVNPQYISNLMAQGDDERGRLLYGCWKYQPGQEELFDYNGLIDLFTNDFIRRGHGAAQRYISADIAFEGSDLFVVLVWSGMRVIKAIAFEKSKGPTIVQTIKDLAHEYEVPYSNIVYDRDGGGMFLAGFIPGAYGFRNGGTPLAELEGRGKEKPDYENLKTQCAYIAAQLVADASIYVEESAMADWMRNRLIEECRAHLKRDREKGGKLKMSKKEEVRVKLKRSPDFFDAFIMRMVFLLMTNGGSSTA